MLNSLDQYCANHQSDRMNTNTEKTNEHVKWLLKSLTQNSNSNIMALILTEDNHRISVPLLLISMVWPDLMNIAQDLKNCCCSEIGISVPARKQTVLHFIELLYTGTSSPLSLPESKHVKKFCNLLCLNWIIISTDVSYLLQTESKEKCIDLESSSNCFVVKECFSEDEDETCIATFQDHIEDSIDDSTFGLDDDDDDDTSTSQGFDNFEDIAFEVHTGFNTESKSVFCSRNCKNRCADVRASWSENNVEHLKEMFKSDTIIDTKRKLINHLRSQNNVGEDTESYLINGHRFCTKYLSSETGTSEFVLGSVLKNFSAGIQLYEHGSKGVQKQQSLSTTQFVCWFKQFVEIYGQNAPDENVIVLAHWLNKATLFKMYKEEAPTPHVASATFYQHMKTYFGPRREDKTLPCVRISKYTTHSVCDICVALNTNQRDSKTEAELKLAKSLRNEHRMDFGKARRTIEEIKQRAISFPEDNIFIQIDGMVRKIIFSILSGQNYICFRITVKATCQDS